MQTPEASTETEVGTAGCLRLLCPQSRLSNKTGNLE
jgi:hypothetical protein